MFWQGSAKKIPVIYLISLTIKVYGPHGGGIYACRPVYLQTVNGREAKPIIQPTWRFMKIGEFKPRYFN